MLEIGRRELLTTAGGTLVAATVGAKEAQSARPKKSILYDMLPGAMADRFMLAKDAGFEGIEAPPLTNIGECEKMRAAAERASVSIHSVIFGGWGAPLSSAEPEVIERGMASVRAGLKGAAAMGCDGLLLVPAVVNAKVRYADAWKRSHANIRKLIPAAQEAKVRIDIEEVWNNFLLSPLEFAKYVDDFKSPWVHAYFDVGNVVRFGWPQDWIRTLGRRIRKVHIKDFKGGPGLGTGGEWVNILDGSIDWQEVRKAFEEIGFTGYMTLELGGGNAEYIRDLSRRLDKIIGAA